MSAKTANQRSAHLRADILHIHIRNQAGELLADIDAASTIDGLAYYLWSRRLEDGDETDIYIRLCRQFDRPPGRHTRVVWTRTEFCAIHPNGRRITDQLEATVELQR